MRLPKDVTEWTMVATVVGLIGSLFGWWRSVRGRRESVRIRVNPRYRVDLARDQIRFPVPTKFVSAKTGELATLVVVTYSGPHELRIRDLYASFWMFGLHRLPGSLPCDIRLRDGQNALYFVLFREFQMEDIEAYVLETTTHGNIIKPVNRLRMWLRNRRFDREVAKVVSEPEQPKAQKPKEPVEHPPTKAP